MVIDSADNPKVLMDPVSSQMTLMGQADLSTLPEIREFFTISQRGSVLITSTNNEAAQMLTGNFAHHIEIEEMSESEAIALLKSKLHSKVAHTEDDARELVKAAEYMPLTISQTAGHISMDYPKFKIADAIEKLRSPNEDTTRLLEGSLHETNRDTRRTNSFIKSWHLSFQYVRDAYPSAARLFLLMCLFDRQNIPEVLLAGQYGQETTAALTATRPRKSWWRRLKQRRSRKRQRTVERQIPQKDKKGAFLEDWRVLNSLMLIKTNLDGDHFSMHRLVQYTTRRWLELQGEQKLWSAKFVGIMMLCFPKYDYDNWKMCQYLFPHAQQVANYRPADEATLEKWATLVHNIAQYAGYEGSHRSAERLGRLAMETLITLKGERDEETLRCVYDLGETLSCLQRKAEAETLHQRAWHGRMKLLGADHLDTLKSAHALSDALSAQERYEEADALTQQLIEGYERVYGATHKNTLCLLTQLTFGYAMTGRAEQAEALHRRAVALEAEASGKEPRKNFAEMRMLAALLNMQGKAAEAEGLLVDILQYWEEQDGLQHDETIKTINFLGQALTQQGKFDEAATHYRRVLDVFSDLEPKSREEALRSLDSLAQVLLVLRHLEEAEIISRRMIDESTKLLGHDHVDIYVGYHTLADVLTQQERFPEALDIYEKAYTGTLSLVGAGHPDTVEFLNDFNAAKNKLLTWPGQANEISTQSGMVFTGVNAGLPMDTCHSQGGVLV